MKLHPVLINNNYYMQIIKTGHHHNTEHNLIMLPVAGFNKKGNIMSSVAIRYVTRYWLYYKPCKQF